MADFTPREMEIMAHAWNCMTEEPKVDYDKLAGLCNMSNPRSASNAWRAIKAKILARSAANGDNDDATPTTTPTKKSPSKKRGGAVESKDDEEGSPTKKARASRKTKKDAKVKAEFEEIFGEEDEEIEVKNEKTNGAKVKHEVKEEGHDDNLDEELEDWL